ncbi:MAG: 23S rRNA (guanosine(2251)-2'-O)-methyltransferase RlmB [Gammaproteobacteria bacterium]|nr:MAG: 23S rRNA (guanosine(2251)-2'-O)-methyltransferase RlmB [Gammaproteobacteria bacterium]
MAERIVCGLHPVGRLLRGDRERVRELYLQAGLGRRRRERLGRLSGLRVTELSAGELEALCGTHKHQGVAARIEAGGLLDEAAALALVAGLDRPALLLVLDGVQDPRNFGACLRSADAAGADLVVVPRSRNVAITPVVGKVAAGAAETQPVAAVANLARCLRGLSALGLRIVGLSDEAADSLYAEALDGPVALVLGAEGRGLRRLTREHCDRLVSLPMCGAVESLNVSVAAGICLYEARRQRLAAGS